jgi:myo-inositol 2-dehydrogenase/D-chiro-inositol 1-dehydrogenase
MTGRDGLALGDDDLRIGVVGAGGMGSDHIRRISRRISGARVAAVVEPDEGRAMAAIADAPGASMRGDVRDALERDGLDAVVIATPSPFHEGVLRAALDAGVAIFCEKPLTPDSASSLAVVETEVAGGRQRIQVGFMRRFDDEYVALRELVASGDLGALLLLHCAHRNPSSGPGTTETMLLTDSVIHEMDIVPWLASEPIVAVEVRRARRNSLAPPGLDEPQLVLLELRSGVLATVEISVNLRFGYQVTTEAVLERGVARIGQTGGLVRWQDERWGGDEHRSYTTRFKAAFDTQIQRWVDAVRRGTIDGASAWDGYLASAAAEAAVEAQRTGRRVEVRVTERPALYDPTGAGVATTG